MNNATTSKYPIPEYDPWTGQENPLYKEENRQWDTGAQRDTGDGKLRLSLLPDEELDRVLKRYYDGAVKYGESNWKKGMPLSVYYDSAFRHLQAWWRHEQDEDHGAAVVWNLLCAMWTERCLSEMDDRVNSHEADK